jgi:hypothetical protein
MAATRPRMGRLRELGSNRGNKRHQGGLGRRFGNPYVGGAGFRERLRHACRHAEMDRLCECGFVEAAGARGVHIGLGAAPREVQHAIEPARDGLDRRRRQRSPGDRAIDDDRAHRQAAAGEHAGKIAGAVGASQIQERGPTFESFADQAREIGDGAIGRRYVGKADAAHRLRAAVTDGEHRQRTQLRKAFVSCNRRRGVGAGDEDRREWSRANLGIVHRLDAQQWGGDDRVAAFAQFRSSPLRVRLGPRHQEPHD